MTRTITLVTIVVALQGAVACTQPPQQPPATAGPQARAMFDFRERVNAYVELRNKVDNNAPKLKQTEEPADIEVAQHELAARIAAARAGARRGDIFSAPIATQFRRLVRPEVRNRDTKQLIQEDNPGTIPFKVNGPYPEDAPLSTVPPNVLASLPELPMDIEYRFVGKHLILRDSRANIVIDYMTNVIA